MSRLARVLALVAVAVLVAACGSGSSPAPATPSPSAADPTPVPVPTQSGLVSATLPPAQAAEVTLLIFSGRQDPSWLLTADETAKLGAMVAALPVVQGVAPQGGLGYHGFAVATTGPDGNILIVTAYAKAISPAGGGAASYWRDDAGLVERFLLETGRPSMAADTYAAAKQALDDLLR